MIYLFFFTDGSASRVLCNEALFAVVITTETK